MSENVPSRDTPIPWWQARALLRGGNWTDAAYSFGSPDVAEAVGTAEEIGATLTRFLNSLERENVEAEQLRTGRFVVEMEVEPLDGCPGTLTEQSGDLPAENSVPCWEASAAVGNAHGVFDACCGYGNSKGDEGHLLGTAVEVGAELARVLQGLTRQDVDTMKYDTDRFFIQLVVELFRKE